MDVAYRDFSINALSQAVRVHTPRTNVRSQVRAETRCGCRVATLLFSNFNNWFTIQGRAPVVISVSSREHYTVQIEGERRRCHLESAQVSQNICCRWRGMRSRALPFPRVQISFRSFRRVFRTI